MRSILFAPVLVPLTLALLWTSLLQVITGKADYSISIWDWTRCAYTACTDYMFRTSYTAIVPLPKPKQLFSAFAEPFDALTWLSLFAVFVATGAFLTVFKARHYQAGMTIADDIISSTNASSICTENKDGCC